MKKLDKLNPIRNKEIHELSKVGVEDVLKSGDDSI